MSSVAVIAAAGRGLRMGKEISKQLLELRGKPVIYHTLAACLAAECFTQLILVVAPGEEDLYRREVLLKYFSGCPLHIVPGGKERQDSVFQGLRAAGDEHDVICIHDGARPLATPELFMQCTETARSKGAVITAVQVKDTIKLIDRESKVLDTPPRQNLWAVQTPQAFRRQWVKDAHHRALQQQYYATDDASLLEHFGYPVYIIQGDYRNIKITTPEDLMLAEILLGREEDAHRDGL